MAISLLSRSKSKYACRMNVVPSNEKFVWVLSSPRKHVKGSTAVVPLVFARMKLVNGTVMFAPSNPKVNLSVEFIQEQSILPSVELAPVLSTTA